MEISFEATASSMHQIWELLIIIVRARIKITTFEIYLIQLPSIARRRDAKLNDITERLRALGVTMTGPPVARTRKAMPSDGFELPALVHMCTPAPIRDAIRRTIWDSVW